jgi:hypothetical protein
MSEMRNYFKIMFKCGAKTIYRDQFEGIDYY